MQFYTAEPTPRTAWRLAVLMGVNTRTYKFALGQALLEHARQGRTDVTLRELAQPYAMSLVEHLDQAPQASEALSLSESDFLAIARAEAAETSRLGTPTERLLEAAMSSMPAMVMQKFHNLRGGTEIPHRFYELTGSSRQRVVQFTPELLAVATSEQAPTLQQELTARWRIVESSFAAGVGRSLVLEGMAVDPAGLVLTDRRRRRPVTGVAAAVIGFQHGRCLICDTTLAATGSLAVDHVFPYSLMGRASLLRWPDLDLDAVWNLAPAHAACNATKSNRPPTPAERMRLARRNAAIMSSPHPLRRTLQLTLQGRGFPGRSEDWGRFLSTLLSR